MLSLRTARRAFVHLVIVIALCSKSEVNISRGNGELGEIDVLKRRFMFINHYPYEKMKNENIFLRQACALE